ncbi:FtsK-like domain-containing protein [Planctomycetes bacterium Pla163]|uniref:FtsK-like domain-containing protein n=1 Tax=Rohdeia mirabilis TaxID=2528008 RepID=A0A518D441_9BACT|nr:FtsK-like domain-containing protein [Planctomycetes bacterium Pla163]
MSKRKRNKGKRQRQKKAQRTQGANNAANAPKDAGLYDADDETESGSDETPVAVVAPTPRATRAPSKPALRSVDDEPKVAASTTRATSPSGSTPVAKASDKVPARTESKASSVADIEGEDWGRFASLAALFALGSFVTVSVVAALWKGTPVDGQAVNVTTGLMGGVIGVFGPLGTSAVGALLMGLAATQIIAPRPLRWPLALAALPALALGGAWLTGKGSVGALLGGNFMVLGILLGLIGLAGGALLVAMAHGFSLERLRPKREVKVRTEDEVEVRPLASAKAAPVLAAAVAPAATAPAPVEQHAPAKPTRSSEPAPVVAAEEPVAAAAAPDRDRVQPLGGGAPVATPVAKPAPPEPERNVVRVLGGASDEQVTGGPVVKAKEEAPKELEVRILKRGVPVSNAADGEIQVAPHEGEIDEPRPYVPKASAASAPAPAAAPKRTVTFASADDGATASVAPAPVAPGAVEETPRPMGGEASETDADTEVAEVEEWEPVAATAAPTETVTDEEEVEDDDEEWEYEEEAEADDEEWEEDDEEEDEESDGGSVAVLEDGSEEESDEDDEEWEYEEEDDDDEVQASDADDEEEDDDEEWEDEEDEEVEETDDVLASDAEEEDDEEEDDEDSETTAAEASEEDDDEEWEYEEEDEPEEVLASAEEAEDEDVEEEEFEAEVALEDEDEVEPALEPVAEVVVEVVVEAAEPEPEPEPVVVAEAATEEPAEEPVDVAAEDVVEEPVAEAPVAKPEPEPEPAPAPAPKKRASRSKKKAAAAEVEPVVADVADPAVPIEQRSLFADDSAENDVVLTPTAPSAPKDRERLLFEAGRMFVVEGRVAVSMLQKRFGLDFKESTEVMDELQERGLIGPYMGGSRREILMDADTWRETVGVG